MLRTAPAFAELRVGDGTSICILDLVAELFAPIEVLGGLMLVVAGCAILEAILEIWPARKLGVADRGIREGILRSLMARDGYKL